MNPIIHEPPPLDPIASERAYKRPRLSSPPLSSHSTSTSTAPSQFLTAPRTSPYKLKSTLTGHKKSISSLSFSPNGQYLVSSSGCSPIHLYSLPSFSLYRSFNSHSSGISSLSFSYDSTLLASTSDDKTVRIWEVDPTLSLSHRALGGIGGEETNGTGKREEEAVRVLRGHLSGVFSVAWSPRGDLCASGGMDETVRVWDVQKGKCMRVLPAHSEPVSAVEFSRDGTMIVSGSWDGYIRIWDTATGQCLKTLVNDDNAPVSNVRFTPNSKFIFTSTLDSTIRLWDYQSDKLVKSYTGHTNRKYCIPSVLTPDGKYLISSDEAEDKESKEGGYRVVKWDLQTRQIVDSWIAHKDVVIALAHHPTLPILATGGLEKDKTIKIWIDTSDPRSQELLNPPPPPPPPPSSSTTATQPISNGANGSARNDTKMEEVVVPFMGT
ncbi:hypothetical protein JCM5353_003834 [Sporobolomyces roseus]